MPVNKSTFYRSKSTKNLDKNLVKVLVEENEVKGVSSLKRKERKSSSKKSGMFNNPRVI